MKKADLKTGMVVVNRRGTTYIVMKDAEIEDSIVGNTGYDGLDNYNEYLNSKSFFTELDIMKVYSPKRGYALRSVMNGELDTTELTLIWERINVQKEIDALMEEKKALRNRLYAIDSEVEELTQLGGI